MSESLKRMFGPLWRTLAGGKAYDIGLHIGQERLNLMQFEPAASRPTVRAAAAINHGFSGGDFTANPRRLKELIKRAFAEQPFRGRRVVTCLPNDHVKILLLNYTAVDEVSESESVIRELRERVRGELDGMVVDYVPVRQEHPSRPKEAIVAMADRDKVTAYLDLLSACGLEVASLDVAPLALVRLVSWTSWVEPSTFPNLLLINFGSRSSYLTVVWGRRLMLDRSIEFAEQRLLARLKNILDIPEPTGMRLLLERGFGATAERDNGNEISHTLEEVLRSEFALLRAEVDKTLVYTASRTHGRTVDRIYVVGSVARYPGIEQLLHEQFSIPVEVLNPFSIFAHGLTQQELAWLGPHSGIAAATGLALRGVPVPWPAST